MKDNKGITLISLVIIVIIMIMLASITAYEANGLINTAKMQAVTTDLLLIQAKVRIINEKVIFENDEDAKEELRKGTKLSLGVNYDVRQEMKDKNILDDSTDFDKYYVLHQEEDLNAMGLENLKEEDGYVVNYETEEVFYVKGVKNPDRNSEKKFLYKLQSEVME